MTLTKARLFLMALVVSVSAVMTAQAAGKCTLDVPLRVTIVGFEGSALAGDSKGSTYQDGVDGVYNTVLHLCSGTYDATMGLTTSRRAMRFTFPAPLAGSDYLGSPAWANSSFETKPFINVRDILWGRMNGRSTFITRMGITSISPQGDSANYRLRFFPSVVDDGSSTPYAPADVNFPNETSPVIVQDVPGTCRSTPGGTLDMWVVTGQATDSAGQLLQIGTLHKEAKNKVTHAGQYNMPFKILIEALKCVPNVN